MENNHEEILLRLENLEETIKELKPEKIISKFKNKEHFDNFMESFKDFENDVNIAVRETKAAIESPIYVGILGHYSHGKSSLLNSMLLRPKTPPILPTGEKIVTSLCTLIQFDAQSDSHKFYEVWTDGKENNLTEEEYQRKVSGEVTGALEGVRNFRIILSTKDLPGTLFDNFAKKKIELLDTPGLGGPYWNDEYALQEWVKEFNLIIICIKATEINAKTSDVVNPYLKYTSKPIIPVVTFWDLWPESADYDGISHERDAKNKAKSNLKKFFSSFKNSIDLTQFVSSINYNLAKEIPKDKKDFYSENWGIDNVRTVLSKYVSEHKQILESLRSKESQLDHNRRVKIQQKCYALKSKFESLKPLLQKELEKIKPKTEYEEIIDTTFDKFENESEREVNRFLDRAENKFNDISLIKNDNLWDQEINKIKEEIELLWKHEGALDLTQKLKRTYDRDIKRELFKKIDKEPLGNLENKHLKQKLDDSFENLQEDITRIEVKNIYKHVSASKEKTLGIFTALLVEITRDIPLLFMKIVPLVVVTVLWLIISWIIPSSWLKWGYIIYFVVIVGILFEFVLKYYKSIKYNKEKIFREVVEKTRRLNRRSDIVARFKPKFDDLLGQFKEDIQEALVASIKPIIHDTEQLSDDVGYMLKQINSDINETIKLCKSIEREAKQ